MVEDDFFSVAFMSAFYNLLPFPSLILCLKRKLVNFSFMWTFEKAFRVRVALGYFQHTPSNHVTPKNKKLDLSILQHLEQLSGLGWVISAYPPTMNVTPKSKKLDLGILQYWNKFRVKVKVGHFSIPQTKHVTLLGLGLST